MLENELFRLSVSQRVFNFMLGNFDVQVLEEMFTLDGFEERVIVL